jgi:hypothetical protein
VFAKITPPIDLTLWSVNITLNCTKAA